MMRDLLRIFERIDRAYGMDTLVPEYSKIRAVRDEVSSRPITPWLTPDTVPPAYITWPSSTAAAGKDAAKKKKNYISEQLEVQKQALKKGIVSRLLVSDYQVAFYNMSTEIEDLETQLL